MERNLSFPAAGVSNLRGKLTWAQIELVQGPADEIELMIAGDDESVEELRVERTEEGLVIAQPQLAYAKEILPRRRWLQICLRVPEGFSGAVDIGSATGMVGAHGVRCRDLNLTTVTGSIHMANLWAGEQAALHTVSGAMAGEGLEAPRVYLRTVSGRMGIRGLRFDRAKANTVSGDISLSLGPGCRTLDIQSLSGAACVDVEGPARAALRSLSGQFIQEEAVQPAEGCLEITATSVSGDLAVKAAKA